MQQCIDQHRAVAVGQDETVAVRPFGVGGVMAQMTVPQYIGDLRHAHRRARVAGIRLLHGIHCQHPYRAGNVVELRWGDVACRGHFLSSPEYPVGWSCKSVRVDNYTATPIDMAPYCDSPSPPFLANLMPNCLSLR